jgi:phospholipid transport system substrate-binding protein
VLLAALALPTAAAAQGASDSAPGTASGGAGDPAADAAAPIMELLDGLTKVMQEGRATPFRARFDQLAPIVARVFNLPQILQTSIGLRWSELPADKQALLLEVFRRYTVASYVANFDSATSRLELLPGRRAAGADEIVETRLIPASGAPTRIDYVMHPSDGTWKVVDVLLDGSISRVAVQRSDFRTLIGSGDGSALISSLQQKVGSLSGGALQS